MFQVAKIGKIVLPAFYILLNIFHFILGKCRVFDSFALLLAIVVQQAEGVFAMIKEDMNFRRFLTRGKANVTVEWYLVSMAYNILKLHHKIQKGRLGTHLITPKTA